MARFQISSQAGLSLGEYTGETRAEALLAAHRDAGYGESDVWLSDDRERLEFANEDVRRLCGDVSDWWIDARNEPLKPGVLGLGKYNAR